MPEKEKIAGEKIAWSIYKKHCKKLLLSINSKNDAIHTREHCMFVCDSVKVVQNKAGL